MKNRDAGTRLESVEDIRRWRKGGDAIVPDAPSTGVAEDGTLPFFPVSRPPMAAVCILDDGLEAGEWVRIREESAIIGRSADGISIPHDDAMSGNHCQIYRTHHAGRWRWHLKDLQSTNGTFARVGTALLGSGQEIMIGTHHFRFEIPSADQAQPPATGDISTRQWKSPNAKRRIDDNAWLIDCNQDGEQAPRAVVAPEAWIGRDPSKCQILIVEDMYVSPRHAVLRHNERGEWKIQNNASRNGVWLRINDIEIEKNGEFLAGEQRFIVKVLHHAD